MVLTASNQRAERRLAYALGARGYTAKPMTFSGLVEAAAGIERYWRLCKLP